jgi:hypothetical protein
MGIKQPLRVPYSVLFLFSGTFVESSGPCWRFNVPFDLSKLEEDVVALFVFDGVGFACNVPVPGVSVVGDLKEDTGVSVDGAPVSACRTISSCPRVALSGGAYAQQSCC